MQQVLIPRLIPVMLAVAFSGSAAAAGFQLYGEQSASTLGNSGAGSAAVAENAGTVYYNPAGMTQLSGIQVSGGVTAVRTNFEFHNNGSSVGALGTAGDGGNGGLWAGVPNAYMSMPLTKDIYVGLGIGAPFGLKTDYDSPWKGGAHSLSFDIKTININPSIAWRVNERVSLGFGLNWQKIDAEYVRLAAVSTAGLALSKATINLSDDAWGWNVGALFSLSPETKLGAAYRSKVKYEVTGDIALSSDGSALGNGTVAALRAGGGASDARASITLPDSFVLSLTHQLNSQWELLGDIAWTGWSSIPKVDIYRTSGIQNGLLAQTLDTNFRDTWRVAVGANYKLNDAVKLRMGVAYDQTPVSSDRHRLTSLPDNNRTWFSLGAQWKPTKTVTLDVGAAYLYLKDSQINNNQTVQVINAQTAAANRGTVTGSYSASAWLIGTQVSVAF